MRNLLKDRKLVFIFGLGLLLRVLFLVKGAQLYYQVSQEDIYYNGDTHSFIWAFENWWHYGHYTFDFLEPDAAFGRLPGYPFLYGLHYLLAGPAHVKLALACTQVLLDTCSALLLFNILARLVAWFYPANAHWAWVPYAGAFLYATYPFAIVWVTIIGTETVATFLTLAWLAWLLRPARTAGHFVLLGLLLAAAFYVREYLGILVPISCLYLLAAYRLTGAQRPASATARPALGPLAALLLVGGTFGALYVLWPIRNYLVSGRIVLIKPVTAGYANYNVDFSSFRGWVLCWSRDEQEWLDKVAYSGDVSFPTEIFASLSEAQEARRGARLAHACGSSFYLYRTKIYGTSAYRDVAAMRANKEYQQQCNQEIAAIFTKLQKSYAARHPIRYWTIVPAQNLTKAFFKSAKKPDAKKPVTSIAKLLFIRGLFAWRSLLVVLGFVGLVLYRQRPLWPAALFVGFIYLFMCVYMRNLEMRYLLQADAVLLVPATLALGALRNRTQRLSTGIAPLQTGS